MKKGTTTDGLVYHAGFPNAGEDQHGISLSLDKLIIKRHASTYFWRLESEVPHLHWPLGTIVVVDRSLLPTDGRIVVAIVEESFILCRWRKKALYLLEGNPVETEAIVWGVVTYVVQEVVQR
ncbi:MAG: hypothetical protein WBB33_01340 [Candidatus Saccharimonadales bacterium]